MVSRSSHGAGFRGGIFDHDNCHSLCPEAHCSIRNIGCMPDERIPFNQPERTEAVSRLTAAALETCSLVKDELGDANMVLPDTHFHTLRRGSETPVQVFNFFSTNTVLLLSYTNQKKKLNLKMKTEK